MSVTHFMTQFTQVSRHFLVNNRKQTKKGLGKTILKMWFQICENNSLRKIYFIFPQV